MTETEAILIQYLDDREALCEEEWARLAEALDRSPKLARRLKEQLLLDELLAEKLAPDRGNFVAQVEQRIRDEEEGMPGAIDGEDDLVRLVEEMRSEAAESLVRTQPAGPPTPWVAVWVVAASLFVAAVVGVWYGRSTSEPQVIVRSSPSAGREEESGEPGPQSIQSVLKQGGSLRTWWGEASDVAYDDGTVVHLGGHTAVDFADVGKTDAKRASVRRGTVSADVTPQPDGRPMTFDTPLAEATVRGTKLTLGVRPEMTRLLVTTGKVELTRKEDDAAVLVEANHYAVATAGRPLASRRLMFPGEQWFGTPPQEAGMDPAQLDALAAYVGGRGCVIRHGMLVYHWGDASQAADVGEVSETVKAYFLLRAVGDGQVTSLQAKVARLTAALECQDGPKLDGEGRHVLISPRDLARFGLLHLNWGNWNGTQLTRPENVAIALGGQAASPAGPLDGNAENSDPFGAYRFGWWTNRADRQGQRTWPNAPSDTCGALGHGGKTALFVIPSLDLVLTYADGQLTTWTDTPQNPTSAVLQRLLAAVSR